MILYKISPLMQYPTENTRIASEVGIDESFLKFSVSFLFCQFFSCLSHKLKIKQKKTISRQAPFPLVLCEGSDTQDKVREQAL